MKSESKLPIFLPKTSKAEAVSPLHLAAVGRNLELDGVIGTGQLALAMNRVTTEHRSLKPRTINSPAQQVASTGSQAVKAKLPHEKDAADMPANSVRN